MSITYLYNLYLYNLPARLRELKSVWRISEKVDALRVYSTTTIVGLADIQDYSEMKFVQRPKTWLSTVGVKIYCFCRALLIFCRWILTLEFRERRATLNFKTVDVNLTFLSGWKRQPKDDWTVLLLSRVIHMLFLTENRFSRSVHLQHFYIHAVSQFVVDGDTYMFPLHVYSDFWANLIYTNQKHVLMLQSCDIGLGWFFQLLPFLLLFYRARW